MYVCFNHDAIETDYTWPYTGPHITSIIFFFLIDLQELKIAYYVYNKSHDYNCFLKISE